MPAVPTRVGDFRLTNVRSSVHANTQVSSYDNGVQRITVRVEALRRTHPHAAVNANTILDATLRSYGSDVAAARDRGAFDVVKLAYSTPDSVEDRANVYPGRTIAIVGRKGANFSILLLFAYVIGNDLICVNTMMPSDQMSTSNTGMFAHTFAQRYALDRAR
jgi:hypothetical protein